MVASRFATIVLATDGSSHAGEALRVAVDLALHYASELVVLSVAPILTLYAPPVGPLVPVPASESPAPVYRRVVEAAVEAAQSAGVENVTGICDEGLVVDVILAHLEQHPADLLVVGSRGLSTAGRVLLGSTSTALVHRAPCPVLVVRERSTPPPPGT